MSDFTPLFKRLRAEAADAKANEPLLARLGEANDIDMAIAQLGNERAAAERALAEAREKVDVANDEAEAIVASATAKADKIIADAEVAKQAAIDAAVTAALAETGDEAAALIEKAKASAAERAEESRLLLEDANAQLEATVSEVETAKAELAGIRKQIAEAEADRQAALKRLGG